MTNAPAQPGSSMQTQGGVSHPGRCPSIGEVRHMYRDAPAGTAVHTGSPLHPFKVMRQCGVTVQGQRVIAVPSLQCRHITYNAHSPRSPGSYTRCLLLPAHPCSRFSGRCLHSPYTASDLFLLHPAELADRPLVFKMCDDTEPAPPTPPPSLQM